MKKLIVILLLFNGLTTFAQKTDFSGTWKLDTNKTAFGEAPKTVIPVSIKIQQQTDKLVLTRILLKDENGTEFPPVTETLAFNGAPFQLTANGIQINTSIHWSGNASFTLNRNGKLMATEIWTLGDSGKILMIDRSVEQTSNGFKYSIKCYYTKE